MTSGVETSIENSADSVPSPASPDKYQVKGGYNKYKEYDVDSYGGGENNNDVKISSKGASGMMLGGSPAELYYKQLLAANVAVLGKAAKMGFNANLYPSREDKRPSTPDDETGSVVSSNEEADQIESENISQKSAFVWSSEQAAHHGHNVSGLNTSGNKCSSGQSVPASSGGGPSLAHWMSVMTHMNNAASTPHHQDPVHYMWNNVDQCSGSHAKDNEYNWSRQPIMKQGYEAKMNQNSDQHNQKGMDDNPMSAGSVATPSPLYNGGGSVQAARSLSSGGSSSTSPPVGTPSSHMLVIPHPINATKITDAHHVVTQNTSGRKYQCKMCPMIFPSKSELQLHSPIHMREVKPYKCTQCNKTFANSSYLSQHTRIHLGIKPYQCEICQRKFTQLSHLQQHVRTHTGQKPYKCKHPNCTKAFSQLSNLQSHSRCHQTDKPYKCNSCYKCFSEEQSLLEHIPKHKESKHLKTHICQFCGKSYTQETYLTKHMQKHSERLEKRPPIIGIPRVSLDTSHYWPKVSPDTANTLVEAINQQEACLQSNEVISSDHLQREMNGNADDYVLRLSHHSVPSSTPSGSSPIHPHEPIITVSTPGAIKTPPSSVSAFTPIQSMGIGGHHHHNHHLNHHQHPHIDRGYLSYNPIAFPGTKISASGNQFTGLGGVPNSMDMSKSSNGLISLHQIHNYRPPLMHPEHFMQLKDKTQ